MTSGIYALLLNPVVELRRYLALNVLNFLFSSEIVDQIDNILSLKRSSRSSVFYALRGFTQNICICGSTMVIELETILNLSDLRGH